MADTATCDLCGRDLLGAPIRYRAEVRIWAAYDVMEISPADFRRDLRREIADCLRRLRSRPLLLLHGDSDRVSPVEVSKRVYFRSGEP